MIVESMLGNVPLTRSAEEGAHSGLELEHTHRREPVNDGGYGSNGRTEAKDLEGATRQAPKP